MSWDLRITRRAIKDLRSLPIEDRRRVGEAFDQIRQSPYSGKHRWLRGTLEGTMRRRVGDCRVLFRLDLDPDTIFILRVLRGTSTTYKKT